MCEIAAAILLLAIASGIVAYAGISVIYPGTVTFSEVEPFTSSAASCFRVGCFVSATDGFITVSLGQVAGVLRNSPRPPERHQARYWCWKTSKLWGTVV